MEDRSLLSVAALFVGGELFVSSDGGDSITIRQNTLGRVEILANGAVLGTAPNQLTSAVTSIVVKGGDEANNINLNEVTNTTYPSIAVDAITGVASIRIEGDDGDDTILSSPFYGDSVLAGDGDDTVTGQGGNDVLDGGDGDDSILGQDGNDSLIGEDGSDSITGDLGDDTISGGDHLDTITGGDGNDSIDAGLSADSISGGNGNDTIFGNDGNDTIVGDAGDDSLQGGMASDLVNGGDGNDTLQGNAGVDTLDGDAGDDSLNGGTGTDSLIGDIGDDTVNGGSENDSLFGSEGNDLILGGAGNDTLDGFLGDDTLLGQGGSDSLLGGGGTDSMNGGDGADIVDSADPIPEPTPVTVSVANAAVAEGNAGNTILAVTLTLSQASFLPVSVVLNTEDGIATAGSDYTDIVNQTVIFAPGSVTQTVNITVATDVINEPNDTIRVVLSNPVNARLLNQEAIATITNDDAPPIALFAIDDGGAISRVNTANGQTTTISFAGGLFNPIDASSDVNNVMVVLDRGFFGDQLVRVDAITGQILSTLTVTGLPATGTEGDIAFDTAANVIYAVFSGTGNPNLFRIDGATGVTTDLGEILVGAANLAAAADVVEFDYLAFRPGAAPNLFGVIAGNVTGNNANFDDSLFSINTTTVVATRIGPLGVDLIEFEGSLEFDAVGNRFLLADGNGADLYSVNPATGAASVIGSDFDLFFTTGLTFAQDPAVPPTNVTVNSPPAVTEGDQGTTTVSFTLTLSQPSATPVAVTYQLVNGTATAGSDFVTPATNTATFTPGLTSISVPVTINGDFNDEGASEVFFLQITSVTGALIGDGSGTATITDDDNTPTGDTLLGNTGNDTLIGGPAADFINGDGGNDLIFGNDGNDTILGGIGPDTINGGAGNDSINGQGGPDVIDGGSGDDIIVWEGASSGDDTVSNESGADGLLLNLSNAANTVTVSQTPIPLGGASGLMQITEGASTVTLDPSMGQVTIQGNNGDDVVTIGDLDKVNRMSLTVRGGLGDDLVNATGANTGLVRIRMEGGDGNDTLIGGLNSDTLLGEAGIDRLRGGNGNDQLIGGASIDSISGEGGNDTLIGGDGSDTLVGDGSDTLEGGDGNDSIRGDQGNDSILGGLGNDTARGNDGNDTISGDEGDDSLLGDTALDSILGGDGNDHIDGGRNDDTLNGGAGNDSICGDHGNDAILGGAGNDTMNGGDGDDNISGQSGNDLIGGGDGDDTVNGGVGDDIITGGDGDDSLLGGDGNDVVLGDQGDDLVNGQISTDTLAGGQGDDTIVAAAAGEINEMFVLSSALLAALDCD